MPKVYQRAAARRDLVEHFVYLAENAGLDTADRFLTNAENTFNELAAHQMIGATLKLRHPDLARIHCRAVKMYLSCAGCIRHGTGGDCWNLTYEPDALTVSEALSQQIASGNSN